MTSWISAADVAAYLGLDDPVAAQQLADAATGAVRDTVGRDLAQQDYDELYQSNYTDYIMLEQSPVVAVSLVSIDGYPTPIQPAAMRQGGWQIDTAVPRKLRFMGYGKLPRSQVPNIHVVYTAGYPIGTPPDPQSTPWSAGTGLPTPVHTALLLTASAIYNAQAGDPNLISESTAGIFSGSFQQAGLGSVPPGAKTLLQPYEQVGILR